MARHDVAQDQLSGPVSPRPISQAGLLVVPRGLERDGFALGCNDVEQAVPVAREAVDASGVDQRAELVRVPPLKILPSSRAKMAGLVK